MKENTSRSLYGNASDMIRGNEESTVGKRIVPSDNLMDAQQLFWKSVELVQLHLSDLVVLMLLPTLTGQLGALLLRHDPGTGMVVYLAASLWSGVNAPVLTYYLVQISSGQEPTLATAYKEGIRFFWRYVGYSIVSVAIIFLGFLLIVPGFIFLRRYALGSYYIVDQDLTVGQALRLSAEQSKPLAGYIWAAFGILFTLAIIAVLIIIITSTRPWVGILTTTALSLWSIFVLPLRYTEVRSFFEKSKKA